MTDPTFTEHQRARLWREKAGLTRNTLSGLTGYSVASITAYEAGRQTNGDPIDPAAMHRYRLACACIHIGLQFDWSFAELEVTRRERITF